MSLTTHRPTPAPALRTCALAAALLLGAAGSALGGQAQAAVVDPAAALAAYVYANGEAMAPEAEARMTALLVSRSHGLSRQDVQQELAAARLSGALPATGEMADAAPVLLARADFNQRQTRQILAAHEAERAERQRVAAAEAEARAAEAARLAAAASAAADETVAARAPDDAPTRSAQAVITETASGEPVADSSGPAPAAMPADAPADQPPRAPIEPPAIAPLERPGSRPSETPAQSLVDD